MEILPYKDVNEYNYIQSSITNDLELKFVCPWITVCV